MPSKTVQPGESIQHAIDTLPATGGVVQLAPGTHELLAGLVLHSGVTLQGEGPFATTLKPHPASGDAVSPVVLMQATDCAHVRALGIDGNARSLVQKSAHSGIYMSGCRNCQLEDILICDLGRSSMDPGGGHVIMTAHELDDPSASRIDAPGVPCTRNVLTSLTLQDPDGIASFGVRMRTNWSLDRDTELFKVFLESNLVDCCWLAGFSWNAIEVAGPATRFNRIEGNTVTEHHGYSAFDCDKGASWNIFAENCARGFQFRPQEGGRLFPLRDQGTKFTLPGGGERKRFSTRNTFGGNQVSGLGPCPSGSAAMKCWLTSGSLVGGNTLDVARVPAFGVLLQSECDDPCIVGNVIYRSNLDAIRVQAGVTGAVIAPNVVRA